MVGGGRVGVEVAIGAKEEAVGAAEDGGGGGAAAVAEGEAGVLGEDGVGGVDMAVAGEAELGGVGSAVEQRRGGVAVVAQAAHDRCQAKDSDFQTPIAIIELAQLAVFMEKMVVVPVPWAVASLLCLLSMVGEVGEKCRSCERGEKGMHVCVCVFNTKG